jgi:hypothetical protein
VKAQIRESCSQWFPRLHAAPPSALAGATGEIDRRSTGHEPSGTVPRLARSAALTYATSAICGRRRLAYMLIELLAVMVLLSVVMAAIATLIWGTMRAEHASSDAFRAIVAQSRLAVQFRDDVARAAQLLDRVGTYQASPQCLILSGSDGRTTVYAYAAGRLNRIDWAADQPATPVQIGTGSADNEVRFHHEKAGRGILVTLVIQEPVGPEVARRTRETAIDAALGGDLR